MKTRSVFPGILILTIAVAAPAQQTSPSAADWRERLKEAIVRATSKNPGLLAMEARIEAARQRIPQATAFPDPEIEVAIKDIPPSDFSLSREDFTMEMLTARQTLPAPGKRSARRASAEADFGGAKAMHAQHVLDIAAEVADSFFALAELDQRLAILERSRERLESAAESARERYRVGKGAQADVLRANLEKTAIEERISSLRAERRAQAARFNSLQFLPADAPVPPIGPVEPAAEVPPASDLLREAFERSPAVAAAAAGVRRAEQEAKLARLERRPEWMLMGYYARREKFEDFVGASVAVNLPFARPRRLKAKRAEKEAELASARADLEAVRNELRKATEEALADLAKNTEQVRLYRDSILPQAEMNYRAAREAYVVGSIDFLTFVRAATDLDGYEGEFAMRVSGVGRSLAALQKASGLPLIEGTPQVETRVPSLGSQVSGPTSEPGGADGNS